MNNKWYGYLSFLSSLFVVGGYNKWFYLSYLIVISSLLLLKYLINKDTAKFKNIISFYSFFMVIIQGIVSLIVQYLVLFGILQLTSNCLEPYIDQEASLVQRKIMDLPFTSTAKKNMFLQMGKRLL